jgi:His/Glu/Gln/Arg/opine family amino acid ABC transporter permease subunit
MLDILVRYLPAFTNGALVTLELAVLVWIGGLAVGVPIGVARARLPAGARDVAAIFFLALASVPILVYLLWAHYPLQGALGIVVNPFITAALVLSLYNGLIVSDLVRGAILNFPEDYLTAARVMGVPLPLVRRNIMMPIVIQSSLPAYISTQVAALHMTLFASLISVDELFRQAQRVNAIEYRAVEVFSLLAIFYFILSFPLLALSKWLESRTTFEKT